MDVDKTSRREFIGQVASTVAATTVGSLFAPSIESQEFVPKRQNGARDNDRIFGFMLDAGRLPELMSYYKRVVDFCASWELNAIQFRIADDEGSALHFKSHPDLVMHKHAFTPDEMRMFAEYAHKRGVDLIPEIESLGHTHYITRSPKYASLQDRDPQGNDQFAAMCPVDPSSIQIFADLYQELATIFPSRYLHGGCDEALWGGGERSRKALQSKVRSPNMG